MVARALLVLIAAIGLAGAKIQIPSLVWDYSAEEQAMLDSYNGHFVIEREYPLGSGDWAQTATADSDARTIGACEAGIIAGDTNWRIKGVSEDGQTESAYGYIDEPLWSNGMLRLICSIGSEL